MAAKRSNVTRAAALVAVAVLTGAGLSGCGGLGRALGLSKQSPDEFAVVTKAPLVLPPDYELRPPKPGEKRPQELDPSEAAKQALFKSNPGQPAAPAMAEQPQLASIGAQPAATAAPAAGRPVAQDNKMLVRKSESFANKLLFGNPDAVPATAVKATIVRDGPAAAPEGAPAPDEADTTESATEDEETADEAGETEAAKPATEGEETADEAGETEADEPAGEDGEDSGAADEADESDEDTGSDEDTESADESGETDQ